MDKRQVLIIRDINNKQLVMINDIMFRGRQNINWKNVENYIKQYIGDLTQIVETQDNIYVGSDFPDEYTGSKDTARLKGTLAKAKANAAQGIPELVKIAANKRYQENLKDKHIKDARYGWYRYDSRFALPVFDDKGNIQRYNIFSIVLVVRHAVDGKMYLYDMINIKKEAGTPFKQLCHTV